MTHDALAVPVEQFTTHLRTERRLSPHTLDNYHRDLSQAATLLAQRRIAQWRDVSTSEVRMLVATQHRQGKGGKSIQRLLSSLRTFYRWLIREGLATHNPADGIRAPKTGRRLPTGARSGGQGRRLRGAAGGGDRGGRGGSARDPR